MLAPVELPSISTTAVNKIYILYNIQQPYTAYSFDYIVVEDSKTKIHVMLISVVLPRV